MANKTENISAFLGLNLRDRLGQGELSRTHNCSARRYPLLTSRSPRDFLSKIEIPTVSSCVANNALYFCTHRTWDNWSNERTTLYKYLEGEYRIEFDVSFYGGTWDMYDADGAWVCEGSYGVAWDPALYMSAIGILDVIKAEYGVAQRVAPAEYVWTEFKGNFEWTSWNGDATNDVIKFTSDDQAAYSASRIRLTCKVAQQIAVWNTTEELLYYTPAHGATTMVGMGANVIIFPEGYYYNTYTETSGHIWETAMAGSSSGYWDIFPCDIEGRGMTATISGSDPEVTEYPAYWVDTSVYPNVLRVNEGEGWNELAAGYCCIRYTYPGAPSQYLVSTGLNKFFVDDSIELSQLGDNRYGANTIPASNVVLRTYYDATNHVEAILISGNIMSSDTIGGRIDREFPAMDYVCECENRLWGVKRDQNEIYACALGNFFSWNRFEGTSMDSWVASRGCPGYWTGCINYLGTPTFFKENHIECVYPASSGAHQVTTLNINGTGPTAPRSIALVDNIVYWQGATGFYAYSGSLPKGISYKLAENIYTDSVGGDLSGFYYVSCKDQDGEQHLLVYDVDSNAWYEEDDTEAVCMCRVNSKLYIFTPDSLFVTTGGDEVVSWGAITGDLGMAYDDRYPEKLHIRTSGANTESIEAYIEYDGNGKWEYIGTLANNGTHRYSTYPFVPRRCDHFRLKFNGVGNSAVWGIDIEYATGGATR